MATVHGLWIVDGSVKIRPEDGQRYRMRIIDFLHALMAILVFAAVALSDQNIVMCLYPTPSAEVKELLATLPIGVGFICSMLSVCFPSKRNGIGFPLSRD